MSVVEYASEVVSVTEAHTRGVSSLVRSAESGLDLVVERHGQPVAAVVSMAHLDALREREADLRDAALVLARAATDTGVRHGLDDVLARFGFERHELEADSQIDVPADQS